MKKIVLGLSITGNDIFDLLALNSLFSFIKTNKSNDFKIRVATDKIKTFTEIKQIINLIFKNSFEFEHIFPSDYKKDNFTIWKNNYSGWWRFDLLNSLSIDEYLLYIDIDTLIVGKIDFNFLKTLLKENNKKLIAVHACRPVLERYSVLNLKSPFDYFNAGVLFGVKSNKYDVENLKKTHNILKLRDPLNIFWSDQDVLNYIMKDDVHLIDPRFNLHNGFLNREYLNSNLINNLYFKNYIKDIKIIHYSDNFILNKKFHPFFKEYIKNIKFLENEIKNINTKLDSKAYGKYLKLINKIKIIYRFKNFDYLLQNFLLLKRNYNNTFYFL